MKNVLLTGAAGFIGSALVRQLLDRYPSVSVVGLDLLCYSGDMSNLPPVGPRFTFHQGDICDAGLIRGLFSEFKIDTVINCAAQTHVDRSIHDPGIFIKTNVLGTGVLLEESRRAWHDQLHMGRFHQISTDEVYGSLEPDWAPFTEFHPINPSSPYSASKAAADHIVRAYGKTYGLPISISNCSNNYGPRQYPEKLLPVAILACASETPIPVYGDGRQRRDWLHVEDHCEGICNVILRGCPGETYNLGGAWETSNLDIIKTICGIMDELRPAGAPHSRLLTFVQDRPGHDRRYSIDARKAKRDLGWEPRKDSVSDLADTVKWYLANLDWVERMRAKKGYREWMHTNYDTRSRA